MIRQDGNPNAPSDDILDRPLRSQRPRPQPIALALRDPELARDLVRVQPVLEQRRDAVELADTGRPPCPARPAHPVGRQPRLDWLDRIAIEAARLFEMDFQARAVAW